MNIRKQVKKHVSPQISSMLSPKGGIVEINNMFMDPVNRVLWRVVTGKPIEENTAAILTDTIREAFRITERAGFTDLLQERLPKNKFCYIL